MTTLILTVCNDEHYFMEDIILVDRTDTVTDDMTEENQDYIRSLLPVELQSKIFIQIAKATHTVIHKGPEGYERK